MLQLFKQFSEFNDVTARSAILEAFESLSYELKITLVSQGVATPNVGSIFTAIQMVSINEYYVEWENIVFNVVSVDALVKSLNRLKLAAINQVSNDLGALNVLEVWESLAQQEAIMVLEHYCGVHDICCTPGENTFAALKRSLNRYGLAQTARYINSAVWNARKYSSEKGLNRYRAFTFIYRNLNFWIEDPRARTYNAPPYTRSESILSESEDVSIFSRFFLEPNGISYFTDPISMSSLLVIR